MSVSKVGEFGLIDRLAAMVGARRPPDLILGIGDDAAAWRLGGTVVLATTDTLVEGVHFLPSRTPWRDLGWKALAVSISDIAAMGGEPLFALVTLALPPETPLQAVDHLYGGLQECAEEYGVAMAGGDVVRAHQVAVTVAVLGRAGMAQDGQPLLLRRNAARTGHLIAVTGTLGDSAAGLRRLREGRAEVDPLTRAHLRPHPPLAAGREAAQLSVPCAIDISDGLLQDLGHICRASGVGAVVRAGDLPLSPELRAAYPAEALALAAAGGEDYQLLLVGPGEALRCTQEAISTPLTIIGEMVDDPDHRPRLVDEAGREIPIPRAGWDHLSPRGESP